MLFGAPGGIRTPDRPVRSRTLYPTKLLVHTQYYNCFWNNFQDVFEDFAKKFTKIVGRNPDIIRGKNGKIYLKGNGCFKGKELETDLWYEDFFNL